MEVAERQNWRDRRREEVEFADASPEVLVIGEDDDPCSLADKHHC